MCLTLHFLDDCWAEPQRDDQVLLSQQETMFMYTIFLANLILLLYEIQILGKFCS